MAKSNTNFQQEEEAKNFDLDSDYKDEEERPDIDEHDRDNYEKSMESACVPDYSQRD